MCNMVEGFMANTTSCLNETDDAESLWFMVPLRKLAHAIYRIFFICKKRKFLVENR